MIEQPRTCARTPTFVALCVVDAMSWLGWWLARSLVLCGAVLSGLVADTECLADLPRPRPLRQGVSLRREVRRGLAEIDAYLSATSLPDATRPSVEEARRTRRRDGDG